MPTNTSPQFSNFGRKLIDLGNFEGGGAVLHLGDGSIVMAGTSGTNAVLVKLTAAGELDTGFGSSGVVTLDLGSQEHGYYLASDASGNLIVGGYTAANSGDFYLARYTSTGNLDTSFNSGGTIPGVVVTNLGAIEEAYALTTVGNDILLAGRKGVQPILLKYTSSGVLDTSFGDSDGGSGKLGYTLASIADSSSALFNSIAYDSANSTVYVAGYTLGTISGVSELLVARYTGTGTLDTAFNSSGYATYEDGIINIYGQAVATNGSGVVVAGYNSNNDLVLARFTSSGSLDTSFDTTGVVVTDIGTGTADFAYGVAWDTSSGKLTVAGTSSSDTAVLRYNSNGTLDSGFGTNGKVIASLGGTDAAYDVYVPSTGGVTTIGISDGNIAVMRLDDDGKFIASFNTASTLGGTVSYTEGTPAVLDSDVILTDRDLFTLGNYDGATLTIARTSTPNSDDQFRVGGTLAAGSANLVVNSTTIGTFSNSGGTLTLTFNSSATQTLVNTALQSISYSNSSEFPPGSVQLDWSFNDGNANSGGTQGDGGPLTATGSVNVTITAVNDAPSFNGSLGGSASFTIGGSAAVLDSNVDVLDAELQQQAHFNGSTLTLARQGGHNSDDVYSSTVVSLTAGQTSANLTHNTQGIIGSYSWDSSGLQLSFNSSATSAIVNEVLRSIAYSNSNAAQPHNSSVQINWSFNDGNSADAQGTGGALGASGSTTVTFTNANTAPAFSSLGGSVNYTEDGSAAVLDVDVSISDTELAYLNNYTGSSLVLARSGGANSDDGFSLAAANGLSLSGSDIRYAPAGFGSDISIGSFTTTGGTLTVTFDFTAALVGNPLTSSPHTPQEIVAALLRSIQYSNSSNTPPATVDLAWSFSDGNSTTQGTGGALTASGTSSVAISGNNDAPGFGGTLDHSATFTAGGSAVVLDPAVTVSDAELAVEASYSGASLTLARSGGASSDDHFSGNGIATTSAPTGTITVSSTSIGSYSYSGGSLTVTFNSNATATLINQFLSSISYSNSNAAITHNSSIQMGWSFSDGNITAQGQGGAQTGSGNTTITFNGINDAPAFAALDGNASFSEGGSAVVLDANVTVGDIDLAAIGNYAGAIFTLQRSGGAASQDQFEGAGITAGNASGTVTTDSTSIGSYSYSGGLLSITFNSSATEARVNSALQSLSYSNNSELPPVSVTLAWNFNDKNTGAQGSGSELSGSGSSTVTISSQNDTPVFSSLNGTPAFTEGGAAVVMDASVTVSDADLNVLGNYDGALLQLTTASGGTTHHYSGSNVASDTAATGDVIITESSTNITVGTYSYAAGSLQVSFNSSATQARVNQVLQSLKYKNTSDVPPASVEISWQLNDGNNGVTQGTGSAVSATGSVTVTLNGVNDAPILSGLNGSTSYTENASSAVVMDASLTISDAELDAGSTNLGNYSGATLTLARQGGAHSADQFGGNGITLGAASGTVSGNSIIIGTYSYSSGTLTITFDGNATTARVNNLLTSLSYKNTTEDSNSSFNIQWTLNDGNSGDAQGSGVGSFTGTTAITVDRVNDAPVFANLGGTVSFTEEGSAVTLDTDVSVSDIEFDANLGSRQYADATVTLARQGGANADDVFSSSSTTLLANGSGSISGSIGSYTQSAGTLTLTFNSAATKSSVEAVLQSLAYSNTSNNPPASVTVGWTFSDGNSNLLQGSGGALTSTGSTTVNITENNDAPAFGTTAPDFRVLLDIGGLARAQDVLQQSDGKLVIAGFGGGTTTSAVLARYNTNGTLDTSFGTAGVVLTGTGVGGSVANAIATHDNKFIIAGYGQNSGFDFFVARFNGDGSADSTFSGDGKAAFDLGNIFEEARDIAVQADGKIVVVGTTGTNTLAVMRLNSDGTLDTSFSGDGILTLPQSGASNLRGVAIDPTSGDIFASGRINGHIALLRIDEADGTLVSSFGSGGIVTTSVGSESFGYKPVITDNKLYLSGNTELYTLALRYNLDGTLDSSFGAAGIASANVTALSLEIGYSLAVQSDGKVVVGGKANANVELVRFTSSGALDTSFGSGGIVTADFYGGNDDGYSLIQQADGKFLLVGTSSDRIALARFNNDGSFDYSFPPGTMPDHTATFTVGGSAVLLDIGVAVSDPELSIESSYNGASLTLARNGGASAHDHFSGNGIDTQGAATGTVTVNSTAIGSYTYSGGSLVVTFNSSATSTLLNQFLSSISYANSNAAQVHQSSITMNWTFSDGNVTDQGLGGAKTATGATTVNFTRENVAPVFTNLGGAAATYTENAAASSALDNNVSVSDIEIDTSSFVYPAVTLTIQRVGGANADDVFTMVSGGFYSFVGTTSAGVIFLPNVQFASYTQSNGTLTIVFDTVSLQVSEINSILREIAYSNTSNTPPTSVTLEWTFSDVNTGSQGTGGAKSVTGTTTVNITAVNDAPVLAALNGTPTFSEGGSAVVLDADVTVSDAELTAAASFDGTSLTLVRSTGANADDNYTLFGSNVASSGTITASSTVIGTYNYSSGQLVLNFNASATQALINATLQGIGYRNTSETASDSVQINWSFSDGTTVSQGAGGSQTGTGSTTITLSGINDAPVFSNLDGSASFTEGGSAVVLDANVSVSDLELGALNSGNGNYYGATLTFARSGGASAQDRFSGANITAGQASGDVIVSGITLGGYSYSSGQLAVTFGTVSETTITQAHVNSVLQAIAYANNSDAPPAAVTINWTFNDKNSGAQGSGGELTATGSSTVTISAVNDAPVLSNLGGTVSYTENGSAVLLDTNASVSDAELDAPASFTNYEGTTLTLTRQGGANAEDVFYDGYSIAPGSGVVGEDGIGTFSQSNGTLTVQFNSTAYLFKVNELLNSLSYKNTSETPPSSVALTWTFSDGNTTAQGSGGALTATGTTTVNITGVNDAPTFGTRTTADHRLVVSSTNQAFALDAVIDSNGNIVTVGQGYGTTADISLSRITSSGLLDSSFGTNGTSLVNLGSNETGRAIATTADGKYLVAGTRYNGSDDDMLVARYNSNGSLDTSFGSSGYITLGVGEGTYDTAVAIAVQGDGKIVVAGHTNDLHAAVARFSSEGVIDSGFGTGGSIVVPFSTAFEMALTGLAIDSSDGHIYIGGHTEAGQFVGRFTDTGAAASGFGTNGIATDTTKLDATGKLALSSNHILLASADGDGLAVANFSKTNGTANTGFDGDGKAIAFLGIGGVGRSVLLQPDGKIVVAGNVVDAGGNNDFAIARFNSDGTADAGFGSDGVYTFGLAGNSKLDTAFKVLRQSDGKLVLVGQSSDSAGTLESRQVALARLNSDGSVDDSFFPDNILNGAPTFSVGSSAVVLDAGVEVTDTELAAGNFSGATLTLVRQGGASEFDQFSGAGITAGQASGNVVVSSTTVGTYSWSGGQLQITFNGSATASLVNQTLQGIAYSNSNSAAVHNSSLIINWAFSDGNSGNAQGTGTAAPATGSTTVTISRTNEPPSFYGLYGGGAFTEGGSAVAVDPFVLVIDSELDAAGSYNGATFTVARSGGLPSDDHYSGSGITAGSASGNVVVSGTTIGTYSYSDGSLSVSFNSNATPGRVNSFVHSVSYSNSSETFSSGNATFNWTLNDGNSGTQGLSGAQTGTGSSTLTLTAVNDAPVFSNLDGEPIFNADTGTDSNLAVVLDADISVTDLELAANGSYDGAVLTIVRNGGTNADDHYRAGESASIVTGGFQTLSVSGTTIGSMSANNGTLTLTFNGSATETLVNAALRGIKYYNEGSSPPTSVQLDWSFSDTNAIGNQGTGGALAASGSTTVAITNNANTAPVFSNASAGSFERGSVGSVIDSDITLVDAELAARGHYGGATLTISRASGGDGTDRFQGAGITAGQTSGDLGIDDKNYIGSYSWNASTGELVLTFNDNASQSLLNDNLQSLQYLSTASAPSSFVLNWTFNDGNAASTSGTALQGSGGALSSIATIGMTLNNSTPVFSNLDGNAIHTYQGSEVVVDADVTVNDFELTESGNYSGAILTVTRAGGANPDDEFSIGSSVTSGSLMITGSNSIATDIGHVTTTSGVAGGSISVVFNNFATLEHVNLALQSLRYSYAGNGNPVGINLDWSFSDGNSGAQGAGGARVATGVGSVQILRVNQAPVFDVDHTLASYVEGGAATTLSVWLQRLIEPDLSAAGNYQGATLTLARQGGAVASDHFSGLGIVAGQSSGTVTLPPLASGGSVDIGTYTFSGGTLTITLGNYSNGYEATDRIQQLVRGIQYSNTDTGLPASVTLQWTFNDQNNGNQGSGGAKSDIAITTVVIDRPAVNDAPQFTASTFTMTESDETAASVTGFRPSQEAGMPTLLQLVDPELAATNYNGTTLTIARQGGAVATDRFIIGSMLADQANGNITISSDSFANATIGTYTFNNGTLIITFNSNATQVYVDGMLSQLDYTSSTGMNGLSNNTSLTLTYNNGSSNGSQTATTTSTLVFTEAYFEYAYALTTFNSLTGAFTVGALQDSYITLNDIAATETADGYESSGENLRWSTIPTTYSGFMFNGGPIVAANGNHYLMTNTAMNNGDTGTGTAGIFAYCFARGTHIATPAGEVAVEMLAIGDLVLNAAGNAVPVKWIGRQTMHPLYARMHHQLPVRISAGALGGGLPVRDLYLSPDHALFIEGCLVHAAALVNGGSIVQMTRWPGDVEYFHIETAEHELVLAEGAAAETFIDNVSREKFDNHADYLALYPDAAPMTELDYPRVKFARQLPRTIARKLA